MLPAEPDPDSKTHFITNLNHNVLRDDSISLTAPNGLLNTSTGTSIDQTPNIIVSVADAVISFGAMGGGGVGQAGLMTEGASPTTPPSCLVDSWSTIFDPTNATETQKAITGLAGKTMNLALSVDFTPPSAIPAPTGSDISGLVYRPLTSARITVGPASTATSAANTCQLQSGTVSQSIVALVPDSNVAYVVPETAGYFSTSTFNLGFSNGTLVSDTISRPSELLGIARIPGQIANDIIAIPTQILQLKYNYDSQATALVNQQATLKAAEIQQAATISTALTAVKNAQTALLQADINQPAAVASARTALIQAESGLEKAVQVANPAATTSP